MVTPLTISKSAIGEAVLHARSYADEVCGLFVQRLDSGVWYMPMLNTSPEPALHFEIGTDQLVDLIHEDMDLVALFHSHPNGRMSPSYTDVQTFPVHYVEHGLIFAGEEILYYNGSEPYRIIPNAIKEGITV